MKPGIFRAFFLACSRALRKASFYVFVSLKIAGCDCRAFGDWLLHNCRRPDAKNMFLYGSTIWDFQAKDGADFPTECRACLAGAYSVEYAWLVGVRRQAGRLRLKVFHASPPLPVNCGKSLSARAFRCLFEGRAAKWQTDLNHLFRARKP
jgi:hypothetical protein